MAPVKDHDPDLHADSEAEDELLCAALGAGTPALTLRTPVALLLACDQDRV
jgi:hypothetical protein